MRDTSVTIPTSVLRRLLIHALKDSVSYDDFNALWRGIMAVAHNESMFASILKKLLADVSEPKKRQRRAYKVAKTQSDAYNGRRINELDF